MAICNKNTFNCSDYYHRQFDNDIPYRLVSTFIPFLSFYKPLVRPLTLVSDLSRLIFNFKNFSTKELDLKTWSVELLKTTFALVALVSTIAYLSIGMVITTTHDIFINSKQIYDHLKQNNANAAFAHVGQLINSLIYLTLFYSPAFELLIVSLVIQVLINLYRCRKEFQNEHYIEATGHLLMSLARTYQLHIKIQSLYPAPLVAPRQIELKQAANIKKIHSLPLPKEGEPPLIYHSGKSGEFKQTYMQSIKNAKKSILIMSFTFSDEEVINLLAKKADQGVDVTLIVDRHLMGSVLEYSDKFTLLTRLQEEGHFHHKVTVLDESMVWMGSANVSPDSLTKQNNTMIGFYSHEIALALHQEKEVFQGLRERSATPFPPLEVGGQKIELLLFPHIPYTAENPPEQALNDYGKKRVIELIDNASKNLRLALCVWTNQELAEAAIRAKARGVDVQVLLWNESESGSVPQLLRDAGISVIQKPHLPLMHNKWMIIDEQTFYNGSANWSKSWFTRNDESALILDKLQEKQLRYLLDYWNALLKS